MSILTHLAHGKNLAARSMLFALLSVSFFGGCQVLSTTQPGFSLAIVRMSNLDAIGTMRELYELPENVVSLAAAYRGDMENIKELTSLALPKKVYDIVITSTHEDYLLDKIAVVVRVTAGRELSIVWWERIAIVDDQDEAICMDPALIHEYGLEDVFVQSFGWAGHICRVIDQG